MDRGQYKVQVLSNQLTLLGRLICGRESGQNEVKSFKPAKSTEDLSMGGWVDRDKV